MLGTYFDYWSNSVGAESYEKRQSFRAAIGQ